MKLYVANTAAKNSVLEEMDFVQEHNSLVLQNHCGILSYKRPPLNIFTRHLTSVVWNQRHLRSLAWISHEIRMVIGATFTILWDHHRLQKQFQSLSCKQNLTHEQTTNPFLANKQFEGFLFSPQACQVGLFLGGCVVKQKIDTDSMFFMSRLINFHLVKKEN